MRNSKVALTANPILSEIIGIASIPAPMEVPATIRILPVKDLWSMTSISHGRLSNTGIWFEILSILIKGVNWGKSPKCVIQLIYSGDEEQIR